MRNNRDKNKAGRSRLLRIIDVAVVVVVAVTLLLMFSVATSADMTSAARSLPHTGGRGRIAIYASGSAIVTGCVVYGLTTLRMRKRKDDDRFEEEFEYLEDDKDGSDDTDLQ